MWWDNLSLVEIKDNVYRIYGHYQNDIGYSSVYLIVEDKVTIIDAGSYDFPKNAIIDAIKELGRNPEKDVLQIIITHSHPLHAGGLKWLSKKTKAPILAHENAIPTLNEPKKSYKNRFKIGFVEASLPKRPGHPLNFDFPAVDVDRTVSHGTEIVVGGMKLVVIYSGGHSNDHIILYSPSDRIIFSGDELAQIPNHPELFYVDLTGSFVRKLNTLQALKKLKIEYLLPTHDETYVFDDAKSVINQSIEGVKTFQKSILEILETRGSADIDQIESDLTNLGLFMLPSIYRVGLRTTIYVALEFLESAGLVSELDKNVWVLKT